MAESTSPQQNELEDDPIYRNSLREARFILAVWVVCFLWTVSYCYFNGYLSHEPLTSSTGPGVANLLGPLESFNRDPESLTYPLDLGIPDWVFYGILMPWVICVVLSFWYGLFMFTEDDLSEGAQKDEK